MTPLEVTGTGGGGVVLAMADLALAWIDPVRDGHVHCVKMRSTGNGAGRQFEQNLIVDVGIVRSRAGGARFGIVGQRVTDQIHAGGLRCGSVRTRVVRVPAILRQRRCVDLGGERAPSCRVGSTLPEAIPRVNCKKQR